MASSGEGYDESAGVETGCANTEGAADLRASLWDAADTLIEEQKARLAEAVRGFAQALRRSGEAFATEAPEGGDAIARAAGQIAAEIEDFSDTIGRRSWRTVLADVEDGVRARPDLFFAGALATGFFVGRLVAGAGSRRATET